MADHVRQELVIDALNIAVSRRRPAPGLIHHSDQGGQYESRGFGQECAGIDWRLLGQRPRRDALRTLKTEMVYRRSWPTRRELISEIFEYIEAF